METKIEKAGNFLNKKVSIAIWSLLALQLLFFFRGCSTNKNMTDNNKIQKELIAEVDSLKISIEQESEKDRVLLNLLFEREGYAITKRTLFDWNSVVRTVARPDDIMNEYDKKINEINKKISESK